MDGVAREPRLVDAGHPGPAVEVVGLAVAITPRPEVRASREQQHGRARRHLTELVLPRPQVGNADEVVRVVGDLVANVHHDGGQHEVGRGEVVHAERSVVEVTRRAVVGPGVGALAHELEVEPVVGHREDRSDRERGVTREQRRRGGIVHVAEEHRALERRQLDGRALRARGVLPQRGGRGRPRHEQDQPRDHRHDPANRCRHRAPPSRLAGARRSADASAARREDASRGFRGGRGRRPGATRRRRTRRCGRACGGRPGSCPACRPGSPRTPAGARPSCSSRRARTRPPAP